MICELIILLLGIIYVPAVNVLGHTDTYFYTLFKLNTKCSIIIHAREKVYTIQYASPHMLSKNRALAIQEAKN